MTPWNVCISYNWQHPLILSQFLWDSSHKLTLAIVIHFLSCDLYVCKYNLRNIHLTLYHHFELPRRKPKAIFSSIIGWYLQKKKKKLFFNYLSSHMYFFGPVWSQVLRTWNIKYLKTGLFFKSSKCDFWISHPKKPTHTKLQDERIWLEQ